MSKRGCGRVAAGAHGPARILACGLMLLCAAAAAQGDAETRNGVTTMVRSMPSEIMPLTSHDLLLDIVNTGRHLIAVGDRGAVLVSNDGHHWAQVQTPTRAALTSVYFTDADNGWAVGHDAVILHTSDGGGHWQLQNFEPTLEKPFLDVLFLDARRGFAVGAYGLIYRTDDGGQRWDEVDTPIRRDEWHFNSIARLRDGALVIAGEAGTLAMSSDQGRTWTALQSPYDNSLFGIVPHGLHGALLYGLRGNAYVCRDLRTGDWSRLHPESVATMFGSAPLDGGREALVGLGGTVLVMGPDFSFRHLRARAGTALSAAIEYRGELIAVGENGIQNIPLN